MPIAEKKSEKDILDEFGIKPCRVILERATHLQISSSSSAKSSRGQIGSYSFKRTANANTRNGKRKNSSRIDDNIHPCKKHKTGTDIKSQKGKTEALVRSTLKPIQCESVEMGEVIVCKMRGYPEWPAIVTGFDKNLAHIQFFGDRTTHKAAVKNFYRFRDSGDMMVSYMRKTKNPLYVKAVEEAEVCLGIPPYASIVRKV